MRRLLDLSIGAAAAVLMIGSVSAKTPSALTVERAYSAEVVQSPAILPALPAELVDPKAAWLAGVVAQGRHWRLDTANGPIHVWVPPGYEPTTAQAVIYVHGYWQDADAVWIEHRLPEQFALSAINAMFVVPEAPRGKSDRLFWPNPKALLAAVTAAIGEPMPKGRVAVFGHSGAYRTVIPWLDDRRIDTVVLLDAAYVDVLPYRDWVRGAKTRRFINVSIDTIRWSNRLHRWLPSTVTVATFPRELTDEMKQARVLYVKSDIGHWPLVTEGVAIPQMLRVLGAPAALAGEQPSLGLPSLDVREPELVQGAVDTATQGS